MSESALQYVHQESSQTLRDALAEYYGSNPGLLDPQGMSPKASGLFRQHDAGHVVFGCDTSLRGETLIDTWTIFGTTIGLSGYLEYLKLPQVDQLFSQVGYLQIAREMFRCLPDLARVLWRSRRLTAKWPWRDYERHLDQELREIRRRFAIRVV